MVASLHANHAGARGDRLCAACCRECREMFCEHIPAPPQKPACYLQMRTREAETVSHEEGDKGGMSCML